ncbi:putative transporter [Cercospora beticola]|uniref:Putative transporter n=1 Tax=Cercospora beticola TaxID=122368 RepID=A0A2G5HQ13_CERBT|nr:putative transporter [Cercospora beticola]PIA94634.1 putative transporter [Cercospora beticola]WPB05229.1 hypothetical protein RHO25_009880 [Cercospora beticola]
MSTVLRLAPEGLRILPNPVNIMGREHDEASLASNEKDLEKVEIIEQYNVNKYANIGLSAEDADFYENFPEDKKKSMIRKIDIRLVPVLALLGMTDDLNLTGIQYNIALSIFFVPYILLEVPSNIILKKFKRPSTYIGILVLAWGIVMTFTGLITNFAGLMVVRVFLGIAEAGFFPGAVYLITRWYAQRQVQTRLALFYCASALSGAFSGLLAFAIARMDGVGGKPGWAWIFILEGIATVLIGVACFFIMPDTPALSGRWLNQEEQRYLEIQTVIKEGGRFAMENDDKFKWTYLRDLLLDYKVYMQAFILFTASMLAYGLKFTMPSITKSMGYTSANAQLMTIPPYVAGAISAIVLSKASDHYQWRAIFIFGQMAVALVGFCILLPLAPNIVNQIGPCYLAVMLICIGQYPTNPAGSAWISSNLAGDTKRAMGIALNICLGNTGGIAGSYIFLDSEKPGYPTGFGIGLGFAVATLFCVVVLELSYWRINKSRDKLDEEDVRRQYNEEQLARLGDKSPLFRYKY